MNNNSQILKGILEGCILQIIYNKNDTYGYEIVIELQNLGLTNSSEGTIYPILTRLEKNKVLKSIKKPSPLGPNRKYYSLTAKGIEDLNEFKETWEDLKIFVSNVFN